MRRLGEAGRRGRLSKFVRVLGDLKLAFHELLFYKTP
jgi:hypothetical protein